MEQNKAIYNNAIPWHKDATENTCEKKKILEIGDFPVGLDRAKNYALLSLSFCSHWSDLVPRANFKTSFYFRKIFTNMHVRKKKK